MYCTQRSDMNGVSSAMVFGYGCTSQSMTVSDVRPFAAWAAAGVLRTACAMGTPPYPPILATKTPPVKTR